MISMSIKTVLFVIGIAAVASLIMFIGINDTSNNDADVLDDLQIGEGRETTYEQTDEATEYDVVVQGVRADGGKFQGVDKCKLCHMGEYDGWSETGHGKDFTPGSGIRPSINQYGPPDSDYMESCGYCHVVGLGNTENGGFDASEPWASDTPTADQDVGNIKLIGIQCESCHGPGGDHMDLTNGEKIENPMLIANPSVEESCYDDGDSGCHGPDGHDKYTVWKASMHSNQDQLDTEVGGGDAHGLNSYCARCKSPSQYDPDATSSSTAEEFTAAEWHGIGCADCHDPHSDEFEHQLRTEVEDACTVCHTNEKTEPVPGDEPHHSQKEAFDGVLGIGVSGQKGMAGVTCVDCHMWQSPEVHHGYYMDDGIGGIEHRESHDFEPKAEACADCHSDLIANMPHDERPANNTGENEEMWNEWDEFGEEWNETVEMWERVIEDWKANYEHLFENVEHNMDTAEQAYIDAEANGTASPETLAEARALLDDAIWNIGMTDDGSHGVHNPDFFTDLLNYANVNANMALKMLSTNGEPIADAGLSKLVDVDADASFDGTGSSDIDGTIAMYFWDFGDDTNGTTASATHSYPTAGTYLVTLTVTDNAGATDTDMISVFVVIPPEIPDVDLSLVQSDIVNIKQEQAEIKEIVEGVTTNFSIVIEARDHQTSENKDDIEDIDKQVSQVTGALIVVFIAILVLILLIYQLSITNIKNEIESNMIANEEALGKFDNDPQESNGEDATAVDEKDTAIDGKDTTIDEKDKPQ